MTNAKTTSATRATRVGPGSEAKGDGPRRWTMPFAVVGGLGMLLTAYLTYEAGRQGALAFCAEGSGCDVVQSSRYSILLGLPLAAWGFGAYLALALSAWIRSRNAVWFVACGGAAVSIYLTLLALFDLDATCVWCLASLALWLAAAFLAWRVAGIFPVSSRLTSVGLALIGVLVLHLHYAGVFDPAAGPEDPYARTVAEALVASGAKFYGAAWCPHCQEQKRIFGASGRRLPYVECAPNGPRAAPATACVAEQITGYPTWIVNGNRYPRMLSVEQLGRMVGVPARAGP